MKEFERGSIVISKAGRDKGRKLVVVEIVDDEYVLVADGDLRKLGSPKRKKRMHLALTNMRADEIVSDSQLRKLLGGETLG